MTTIDSSTLTALNGNQAVKTSTGADLQDSFMTLLVTQLQNQDPTNPMENAEMTSQLAQINTVSGISELNDTLATINQQIDAGQTLQAASLIGKGVLVPGDRILVGEEGVSTPIGVELASPADQVAISIVSASGEVIRQYQPVAMSAGMETLQWDGRLNDGTLAPAGSYRVVVSASNEGSAVSANVLNYALVSGISPGDDGPLLDLGGVSDPVTLDQIRQIL
ncbi:flagellar hook assembly protein FlgD [Parahaliea aestuarii]|uniref:Basal-body rod modification protein FlgD n=1 Tax=Parahaliea aestuarii TaxID=1852021 RepID=A0A5C9A492_9GAMM|nr:flagellar hook assembly protein FlgD [Parahaliea aestuarii]TXS94772.1 flagellar hook assembly protein FlgD [Parahaliea aestuarii]